MPSLDDVYRKFGEASEAAQLLETELGNLLLEIDVDREDLIRNPDSKRARDLVANINSHTLGSLLKQLTGKKSITPLEDVLKDALEERNRLTHSFFRQHNFRRNSEQGRAMMLADLEAIRTKLLEAYKALLLLSGIDVDAIGPGTLSTKRLPI